MKRLTTTGAIAALAIFAAAQLAVAQNADQNTAGPTRNQLQLRLSEPREGQQISGSTIRVAVAYNTTIFGAGTGTKFGEKNFPHPIFDVYVDNALKQSLKGGDVNVAQVENVSPGPHKIVVMAKNISGEVIDRTEVNVVNVEASAASTSSAPAPVAEAAPPAPAPEAVAPAPSVAPPPPPAYTSTTTEPSATSDTLPATASNAPATALLGLTLLSGGLLVMRRKAR